MAPLAAVLFADITGSTTLYERLGNERAKELVTTCLRLLAGVVTAHRGEVVQNIGDEIMCTFADAASAADAAREMQRRVLTHYSNSAVQLKIRVGFCGGEFLAEGNNLYGDAVNTAARLSGIAKGDQIFTSQATIDAISTLAPDQYRLISSLAVKGKQEPLQVCELIWRNDDLTAYAGAAATLVMPDASPKLFLAHGGVDLILGKERQSAKIGRTAEADILLASAEVSRAHATIELRKDKFYLADHSTNGTTIRPGQGAAMFLHREEAPLVGSGTIHCGTAPDGESAESISYFVK